MIQDRKYRILIAGCGEISHHWFEFTLSRSDCSIVGLVDINLEAARKQAKRFSVTCPVFTDLDEALASTHPDVLYDLTYVTTHIDVTVRALRAGCSVLSEKPMSVTREQAKAMINEAKTQGKFYSVLQSRRYQKPVQALHDVIASGKLGKIWLVTGDIYTGGDLKSIRNQLEKPMLQDNAVHTFDGARFITGADPVTVYCHSYHPENSIYKGDAAGSCIFEMSDGSVFVYNCVLGAYGNDSLTSWESTWRVYGSKGSAIWDGVNPPFGEVLINPETREVEKFELETDWDGKFQHAGCIEEMFEAFVAGRKSATDCTDNYKSMSMVFAAIESASKEQKVRVLDDDL